VAEADAVAEAPLDLLADRVELPRLDRGDRAAAFAEQELALPR
jgi:hypothetical protein